MAKKKPQDSVSFVKERCEEAENWTTMRQVMINRAFYNSQQWISWDKTNKRVYVPELRPGEKRLTFNKIKPAVLTLLSKMCKNRVKLEVLPDTNDIDRIEVAKGGIKFIKYQWDTDEMDRKCRRLRFHMLVDGFPALKVYVDQTKGEEISIDEELAAEMDGELKQMPTRTGKIVTQVTDQFALKVDPNAEDVTEIRWVIEEHPEDVDDIKNEWGVEVAPEDNISMRNDVGEYGRINEATKKYKHHAMVRDYWELPSAQYPKGRRIVIAGDKELENTDDPGEFPYIFFPAVPIPGTAIGTGVVTDMTTPQKSYNIKRTAEARILEEMGNPMWLIPKGSMDDEDEIVNDIGAIAHYNPIQNGKPERVPGASVDAGWQNAMERDEADIEDISGAHEISQGATPRGNNTLGGLQLQVEQDETKIALLVQSYEDGMKQWGEKVLRLVQKHFPEEQQLSIVGENGQIEAFAFSGADLTGKETVDVVPGSSMPTLKAVQDDKIMAMWGAGMFNNPNTGMPDTRKVVRMLGESIATQYFDDTEQDENKALMEHRMWDQAFSDPQTAEALTQYTMQMQMFQQQAQEMSAQGVDVNMLGLQPPQPPPVKLPIVRDFYDHETHIMAHNRFRKSDKYDQLPPEFQQIIDRHVAEHQQFLMAPQIQAQQEQQAQMDADKEAQSQEAEKARQNDEAVRQQEHERRLAENAQKGEIAMKTALLKGAKG